MKKYLNILIIILFYVVDTTAQNFEWAKNMDGNITALGQAIAVDDSGNIYSTGIFSGTADFDPGIGVYQLTSSGNNDFFILKLNALGNFLWAKRIGNSGDTWSYSITVDSLNDVYITGAFGGTLDFNPNPTITHNLTSIGAEDMFVLKLSRFGNFVWVKATGGINTFTTAHSITYDKKSNIYVTGAFSGTVDFNFGTGIDTLSSIATHNNSFILKIDINGNFIWVKGFSGPDRSYGLSIAIDSIGNICSTGTFMGAVDFDPGAGIYSLTALGLNTYISKLNSSGNFIWAKYIEPSDVKSICTDNNGNVSIAGSFTGSIEVDPGPATYTLTSLTGNTNMFIVKLDLMGNFVWAKNTENTYIGENSVIASDGAGNIYTTGYFYGATVDFDPNISTYLLAPFNIDLFILKLNASGNFVWVKNAGGTNGTIGAMAITLDKFENIYTIGWNDGTTAFNTGPETIYLTAAGTSDLYISKLNPLIITSSNEFSENKDNKTTMYPNPNNGNFIIASKENMKLNLINNLGQIIQTIELSESNGFQENIKVSTSGMYFITGQSSHESVKQKIIVTK